MDIKEFENRKKAIVAEYNARQKQLKDEAQQLKKSYKENINTLGLSFAESVNPFKVGDLITFNGVTIKIEDIKYALNEYGMPMCEYTGRPYKKLRGFLTPLKTRAWDKIAVSAYNVYAGHHEMRVLTEEIMS